MPLVFLIVAALVLGLGLVQVWTIWFLRREVQRLEFRLNESLDDEDLLEFQERLRGLLSQAKETADDLAESADRRREALEQSLEKARQAEKSLALRILAKTSAEAGKDGESVPQRGKPGGKAPLKAPALAAAEAHGRMKSAPAAAFAEARSASKPPARVRSGAVPAGFSGGPAEPGNADPEEGRDASAESPGRDARRIYLDRPQNPSAARYQEIYDWADQGLGLEQIAKQSGLLAGEVDLILNLRRKRTPGV